MIQQLESVVARLQRQQGVLGVMLVGIEDGMVIAGDAGPGRDSDTAAALAASLFRRTRIASGEAGLGDARFVRLEADRGHSETLRGALRRAPQGDGEVRPHTPFIPAKAGIQL